MFCFAFSFFQLFVCADCFGFDDLFHDTKQKYSFPGRTATSTPFHFTWDQGQQYVAVRPRQDGTGRRFWFRNAFPQWIDRKLELTLHT